MFKQLHVVSKVTCFFFSRLKKAEFEWSSKLQGNISQNFKKNYFCQVEFIINTEELFKRLLNI